MVRHSTQKQGARGNARNTAEGYLLNRSLPHPTVPHSVTKISFVSFHTRAISMGITKAEAATLERRILSGKRNGGPAAQLSCPGTINEGPHAG